MEQLLFTSKWFCLLLIFTRVTSTTDELTSSSCTCAPSPPATTKSPPSPPTATFKPPQSPPKVHQGPPPPRFYYFDSPTGMTPPMPKSYPPPAYISSGGNNGGPSPPRFVYFPSPSVVPVGGGGGSGGGFASAGTGPNNYPYPYYMYDSKAASCSYVGILWSLMLWKQVAIIGAGVSGLVACKYCLSKGFKPVVFESMGDLGGVWAKTIRTTRLQTFKGMYEFADFPWPASVTEDFPTQHQLLNYLRSYATHFDLIKHIQFNSVVKEIDYQGPSSFSWTDWSGLRETFPEGKWKVTVENNESQTKVHDADFVILCVGRFKDVPNIPEFATGTGPEVFRGKVIHSMEYSAMEHEKAEEFVKGKRVVVVGFQKQGLDIAVECSSVNGTENPCTVVYRKDRWKLPDFSPWGIPLQYLYLNRFSELMVHKPGEGFLLGLLATLLSPLRWGISKLVETHIKRKLPLAKFNMIPERNFAKDMRSCVIAALPGDFFDRAETGSIIMKKCPRFSFYNDGVLIDGDSKPIQADIVILATGFKGIQKLKNIFKSQEFGDSIAVSPDSRVALYRECIQSRIPQLAVIGFSESFSNLLTSEIRCRWLVELLDGKFKLPSIKEMEKDISNWDDYMKKSSGEYYKRSCLTALDIWYNDQLCKDIGWNPRRKNGFWADLFQPYGPTDYAKP